VGRATDLSVVVTTYRLDAGRPPLASGTSASSVLKTARIFGMRERRGGPRFGFEGRPALGIPGDRFGQHLDRHVAAEPRLKGPIDRPCRLRR
jgi:hypothetical protein